MKTNTKFLPGFPTKLHGRQRRRQLETLRRQREKARLESISDFGTLFDFVLPLEKLRDAANDKRERTYPEPVAFWGWFAQIVGGNASCATAVAMVQAWFRENGLLVPSAGTSAFCRAPRVSPRDSLIRSENFAKATRSLGSSLGRAGADCARKPSTVQPSDLTTRRRTNPSIRSSAVRPPDAASR